MERAAGINPPPIFYKHAYPTSVRVLHAGGKGVPIWALAGPTNQSFVKRGILGELGQGRFGGALARRQSSPHFIRARGRKMKINKEVKRKTNIIQLGSNSRPRTTHTLLTAATHSNQSSTGPNEVGSRVVREASAGEEVRGSGKCRATTWDEGIGSVPACTFPRVHQID